MEKKIDKKERNWIYRFYKDYPNFYMRIFGLLMVIIIIILNNNYLHVREFIGLSFCFFMGIFFMITGNYLIERLSK